MNDLALMKWARDAGLPDACDWRFRLGVYAPGHVRYRDLTSPPEVITFED